MKTAQRFWSSVFFAAAIFSLASCEQKKPSPDGQPTASAANAAAASAAPSSAADKLAALGFHVFTPPQQLPPFAVQALAGEQNGAAALTPQSIAGTVTLLNFWATWCPPCRQEMPSINRLEAAMKGTSFKIAAIDVGEDRKTVSDFIKKSGYTFPVYIDKDGQLGQVLASQGIPTTYILDKNGFVIAGSVGSREYDSPEIIAILKELAAQ